MLPIQSQQLGKAQHRIQWRAQLMTHARQELALGAVGRLGHLRGHTGLLIQLVLGDVRRVAIPDQAAIGLDLWQGSATIPANALAFQNHTVLKVHRTQGRTRLGLPGQSLRIRQVIRMHALMVRGVISGHHIG